MKFVLAFVLFALISCEKESSGTCEHIYSEPLINIKSVFGDPNGLKIDTLLISNITFENSKVASSFFNHETQYNITKKDSALLCIVPAGFAIHEGKYSFTISANGYKTKSIQVNATYSKFDGGCPSFNSDGTNLNFILEVK